MMLDPNFNVDDMEKDIERWDRIDRWTITGLYIAGLCAIGFLLYVIWAAL